MLQNLLLNLPPHPVFFGHWLGLDNTSLFQYARRFWLFHGNELQDCLVRVALAGPFFTRLADEETGVIHHGPPVDHQSPLGVVRELEAIV